MLFLNFVLFFFSFLLCIILFNLNLKNKMSEVFNSYMDSHLEEENYFENIKISFDIKNDEVILDNEIDKCKFIYPRNYNTIQNKLINKNSNKYLPKKEMKYN